MVTKDSILEKLKGIQDPEIRMNIVDLGLVYEVVIDTESNVLIRMTLTSPACPVGPAFINEIKQKVGDIADIKSVEIEVVWEPPWSPERMTEEARMELGLV